MKYSDLIQFEPINEVVKFDRLKDDDYRKSLVHNFVFSDTYEHIIIPEICRNLDYTASYETFGLQIVGNYGTGKSHLMSLFSLVAENADYLPLVRNDGARKVLGNIAGKYKIIRFELGSTEELWDLVGYQIDLRLQQWGIDYSILADKKQDMYTDKLSRLMAHFEEKFPDKGLMIVIDEMLSYLKGRATDARLNRDLAVLQALGQMCDRSKFRMVFGVQELIYNTPQFQFAADMLGRVNDRYRQITITKQDVQFVVQERLLCKDDRKRAAIRNHLSKFTAFFTDMHANLEEYVNLFPVNPSFFDNFQQIKVGKSQREVLKTLSERFSKMKDLDVPEHEPGLICYDHYWDALNVPGMMTEPDVKRVSDIMSIIHQKIDENFTAARAKKAPLAHRIANACAVKILQDSLEKTNGANVETLVDDLCYIDATVLDREMLIDVMATVARQIVTATVGQYFEQNEQNQEYHLRIEGGVNYEQKIKDYIATMDIDIKDAHFFNFLVEYLPIETDQYRREFKIFQHRIEWKSHKTMLDGYIFMGNPAERSTTHPQQNFYIYFMPIFNKGKVKHGDEPDSVYIHLDKCSDEMRSLLEFYAAAEEQMAGVDSSQKGFYKQYRDQYAEKLKKVFQRDFVERTEVYYQGQLQPIAPHMMAGGSKEEVISNIAATLLEEYFCRQKPDYPKFTLLRTPLTADNRAMLIKGARGRIANPTAPNRDGDAILAGMGLLTDGKLDIEACPYALSIVQKLEDKGAGQVLNRDEILYRFYKDWDDDWRSRDFHLESDLEFLVLAALVALGKIEINLSGKSINAANLREIVDLPKEASYSFTHICRPKNMNIDAVRTLSLGILGKDITPCLDKPEVYAELVAEAKHLAKRAVEAGQEVKQGIYLENIEVLSPTKGADMRNRLTALSGMCDKVHNFASLPKMCNLPWSADELNRVLEGKKNIAEADKLIAFANDFRSRLTYLEQARQYMASTDMKQRTTAALDKMADVIRQKDNGQVVTAYRAELDALKAEYADWYLAEYKRMHITGLQDSEKRRIASGREKQICDAVMQAGRDFFSVAQQYADWNQRMASLTPASGAVNRDAVLRSPYQGGFNPSLYAGKALPTLASLKEELNTIFDSVNDSLHSMAADETLLRNKDILDQSEQQLLDRFSTEAEPISTTNASRLMEVVMKLHRGINRIILTHDDICKVFNRPMTPDDAIRAFRQYINSLTGGGHDDNIRIILK